MIIKIWLREQNLICVSYEQNIKNEQRSNHQKVWPLSFNIQDYIQWLYFKFIAHMLTQINWVKMYDTIFPLIRDIILFFMTLIQILFLQQNA